MQKYIGCVILLLLVLTKDVSGVSFECQKKILQLLVKSVMNRTEFAVSMLPYLIYSGKTVNDLGLPTQCIQAPQLSYFTVEIDIRDHGVVHETYYGFCFDSACSQNDLNLSGDALIRAILNEQLKDALRITFVQPSFQKSSSAGAIVLYCGFSLLIVYGMVYSLKKWKGYCANYDDDDQQTSDQINLSSRYEIRLDDDYEPQLVQQPLEARFSLQKKFLWLQESEETNKIMSFSCFKLFAVPWLIFGQTFYLSNFAAYNYFSFDGQIYTTFYSKLAVAAYYLPDIFFFISAFLFTSKLLAYETNRQNLIPFMGKQVGRKFIRLYPLFFTVILIYWLISPTLHSGPVWFVYENQAKVCNYASIRAFLLIDNWFTEGCYSPAWFVQVELQLILLNAIVLYCYFKSTKWGLSLIGVMTFVLFILLFVISAPLPSSVDTMVSDQTEHYFKSTYSHAPFYLMGMLFAICSHSDNLRDWINVNFLSKRAMVAAARSLSIMIILLIILRPSLWQGVLGFELGLCRTGIFISTIPFFLHGMLSREDKRQSNIHKYAQMTYPVILVSGIVTMSAFWCYETFPYVSWKDLATSLIASLFISVGFGGFLGLLIGLTKPVYK